jgi:hypothetical protein
MIVIDLIYLGPTDVAPVRFVTFNLLFRRVIVESSTDKTKKSAAGGNDDDGDDFDKPNPREGESWASKRPPRWKIVDICGIP